MQELKDKILAPLLLLGIIAVISLVVWAVRQPSFQSIVNSWQEGIVADDPTLVADDPVEIKKAADAIVEAIDNRDLTACAALESSEQATNCEQNILRANALDADNPAACRQVAGELNQKMCAAEIYYTRAIVEDSPGPCELIELPDWQATCLARFNK